MNGQERGENGGETYRDRENEWRKRKREEGQKASFVSSPSAAVLSSLLNMLFHLQPCRDKDRANRRGEERRGGQCYRSSASLRVI